ncbi:MAG: serine hydrolase [Tenuifilaceae bacterium]
MRYFLLLLILWLCIAQEAKPQITDSIQSILNKDTTLVIKEVFSNPESYKLKIIISQISDDGHGHKQINSWRFRDTISEYFYPASLVKIPMAFSLMEFINENKIFSKDLSDILVDTSSFVDERSLRDDLMLMLSASDNNAFSRLYNFIGCKYLNINLLKKRYKNTYLVHRFEPGNETYHQTALPVKVLSSNRDSIFSHPADSATAILGHLLKDSLIGKAYFLNDSLIQKPKGFRYHNYVDIRDIHDMMISFFYPEFIKHKPFNIKESQRDTILKFLQSSPLQANFAEYSDTSVFHPNFLKILLFGRDKNVNYPGVEFYNKSAMAYGFMADCCYLRDPKNNVEFFLTVYMYLNKDEILNDNKYEYDTIGIPFMRKFGELIYLKMKEIQSEKK